MRIDLKLEIHKFMLLAEVNFDHLNALVTRAIQLSDERPSRVGKANAHINAMNFLWWNHMAPYMFKQHRFILLYVDRTEHII